MPDSTTVRVVIGAHETGQKVLLVPQIAAGESTLVRKGVVEDLGCRGLVPTKLGVVDGNTGPLCSIRDTWPTRNIQRCTKHKLENLLAAAPKHCHEELKRDYRAIVYADNLHAELKAYDAFMRKRSKLCEGVAASSQEAGHELLTFYRFPKSQRKNLRTTNQIERLDGEFRRRWWCSGGLRPSDTSCCARSTDGKICRRSTRR